MLKSQESNVPYRSMTWFATYSVSAEINALRYGTLDSWDLSNLSHSESSWIKSRKGVPEGEIGDRIINLEDIKEDAKKVRLYDNVYDMYYDEFEDADENEREAVVS